MKKVLGPYRTVYPYALPVLVLVLELTRIAPYGSFPKDAAEQQHCLPPTVEVTYCTAVAVDI
jgi:hypothetical protein